MRAYIYEQDRIRICAFKANDDCNQRLFFAGARNPTNNFFDVRISFELHTFDFFDAGANEK